MDASSAFQDSLPLHPDRLIEKIDSLGLAYTSYSHPPLRTVADSKAFRDELLTAEEGGFHIKNLYLRDKKKRNYLAVIQEDKEVDLKALAEPLGAGRISFGSQERLLTHLGVRPGAVTPLAMMHGVSQDVTIGLDRELLAAKQVYMHPLVNDRTIGMSGADVLRFLEAFSITPIMLDIS